MSLLRLLTGGALCCTVALAGAAPAHAADLTIPIDTVIVSGISDGETVEMAAVSSSELAGSTCAVRSVHRIDGDPHSGNDLIVSSNGERTMLLDVEREAGAVTDGSTLLEVDELITIELVMGPDEVFGGAVDVELDCGLSPTGTDSQPPSSPTTPSSSETELPATGAATSGLAAVATVLIVTGVGFVAIERRSRRGSAARIVR